MVFDIHLVIDHAAGMSHPLAAAHELIVGVLAKRVAHAAVMAGDADAPATAASNPFSCSLLILPMVQIGTMSDSEAMNSGGVGIQRLGNRDLKSLLFQPWGKDRCAFIRS
jgi:hypothetical protein